MAKIQTLKTHIGATRAYLEAIWTYSCRGVSYQTHESTSSIFMPVLVVSLQARHDTCGSLEFMQNLAEADLRQAVFVADGTYVSTSISWDFWTGSHIPNQRFFGCSSSFQQRFVIQKLQLQTVVLKLK